ncbi:NifU family protein [Caproiciproducens sp.]
MQKVTIDLIEDFLNSRIRPILLKHGGGVEVTDYQDGILKVRMLGQCSNCPGAVLTNQDLIEQELRAAFPEIRRVILATDVSDELMKTAFRMMKQGNRSEKS